MLGQRCLDWQCRYLGHSECLAGDPGLLQLCCHVQRRRRVDRQLRGTHRDVPAPVVSIAVSPASIATDHTATLTWSASNATSCVASGSWSGPQAVSGSTTVANSTPGSYTYALS